MGDIPATTLAFLDDPELSAEERTKLRQLGATTALAVLSMRQASHTRFDEYFGVDSAERVSHVLTKYLSDEDRELLARAAIRPRGLGARLKK